MSRFNVLLLSFLILLLTGCSIVFGETPATPTLETSSPVPTYEPLPSPTPLSAIVAFPTNTRYVTPKPGTRLPPPTRAAAATPDSIIAGFKAAGLQAEYIRKMTKEDYGTAPMICNGMRFTIPSIGGGKGGRVFVCRTTQERDTLAKYYTNLGKVSKVLASWVYTKGLIVVTIDHDLKEPNALKYQQAIP